MEPHTKPGLLARLLSPTVGIPLLVLVAVLCAPFVYRNRQLAGLPDIGDPFDVEAFCDIPLSNHENAFVEFDRAGAMLAPQPALDDAALDKGWSASPPELQQWVIDNRPALEVWRKGTEKPDALFMNPAEVDIETDFSPVSQLREFAQLARLEASRLEGEGDVRGAWEMFRALFRSSRLVGRHGAMIEFLIAYSLQGVAANGINQWASDPRVDRQLLETALTRVRADAQLRAHSSTSLAKVEYLSIRNTLERFPTGGSYPKAKSVLPVIFWVEYERTRRIMQHYFAEEIVSLADEGSPESVPPHLSSVDLQVFIDKSLLSSLFLVSQEWAEQYVSYERARQAAIEMALAAQIHYREHGAFPEKAEELLQTGLDAIADDPFSHSGRPMQYRVDAATGNAVVWSAGKDGVDDGGDVESTGEGDHEHPPTDVGYVVRVPAAAQNRPTE
ncbi:MAG: hypothetical protein WD648_11620 [Planctomycetaceae bacterium]